MRQGWPDFAEAEAGVFGEEDDFQLSQEEVAMLDALSSPEAAKPGPKRGSGRGRGSTARGRGRGRKAAGDGGSTTAAGKKSRCSRIYHFCSNKLFVLNKPGAGHILSHILDACPTRLPH